MYYTTYTRMAYYKHERQVTVSSVTVSYGQSTILSKLSTFTRYVDAHSGLLVLKICYYASNNMTRVRFHKCIAQMVIDNIIRYVAV